MNRRYLLGSLLPVLSLCCAGCSRQNRSSARQFPFRGEVIRLDQTQNLAYIHNEDVRGWMAPMTMEYAIESRSDYALLHPGVRIAATVNVGEDGYWLSNIEVLK